jgi:hypothetical protein
MRLPHFTKITKENLPKISGRYYYFMKKNGIIRVVKWFSSFSLSTYAKADVISFAKIPPNFLIWAEMAIRKVRFHNDEPAYSIILWGLFFPSEVKGLVKRGLLIPVDRVQTPKCKGWYYPSMDAYEKYILPIISVYSLDEMINLAGWNLENKDFD